VTYYIPTSPSFLKTTIVLPPTSSWTSGLHWHNTHTENLRLVQGSIFVRLGDSRTVLSAKKKEEGEELVVRVLKGVRHEWMRAESYFESIKSGGDVLRPEDVDEEVVVEEWTEPMDISKALFFWNLNGIIIADAQEEASLRGMVARRVLGSWWVPLQLFVVFWELDNWPVFFESVDFVEYVVTGVMLAMSSLIGKGIGLQVVSKRRTPKQLWDAW
ncbi:hypothetical protein EJ04DRAFT_412739, partial [Polyplosphaeria fusca]